MNPLTTVPTPPTSLVTLVLDKSGSMLFGKESTISAFNAYVGGLQEAVDAKILFSFLQFSSLGIDKVCAGVPVSDVRPLTDETYLPMGNTPLIDAAVLTIRAVEKLAATLDEPKIVVCIQTDGQENCSTQYTWEDLNGLVAAKTALGWQFNFMGAGIDAYAQGAKMGIGAMNTMSYDNADAAATNAAFHASASNHVMFARGMSSNTAYSGAQRAASGDRFAARPPLNWGSTGISMGPTPSPTAKLAIDLTKGVGP
jgi:hypothetical protein